VHHQHEHDAIDYIRIYIIIYAYKMCYMPVDVCPFCGKEEFHELVICNETEPSNVCLSVSIANDLPEDGSGNVRGYMFVPVRSVRSSTSNKIKYYIAVEDVVELEYMDVMCEMCEKRDLYSGMDEWEN
jgi:hypothetical protein